VKTKKMYFVEKIVRMLSGYGGLCIYGHTYTYGVLRSILRNTWYVGRSGQEECPITSNFPALREVIQPCPDRSCNRRRDGHQMLHVVRTEQHAYKEGR
jgi:hypothetical protein